MTAKHIPQRPLTLTDVATVLAQHGVVPGPAGYAWSDLTALATWLLGLALPAGAQEVATLVAPEPVEPTTLPTTGTGTAASSSLLLVLG